jgi:hypothetical protein
MAPPLTHLLPFSRNHIANNCIREVEKEKPFSPRNLKKSWGEKEPYQNIPIAN